MKIFYLLLIIAFLFSCEKKKDKNIYEIKALKLGTSIEIKYLAYKKDIKLEKKIIDYIDNFENNYSYYKKNSIISKINSSNNSNKEIKINSELCDILKKSIYYNLHTENKFDITYKSKKESRGSKNIKIDCKKNTIKLLKKDMILDLGGIAKGYSVDMVSEIIKKHGYNDFFVNFGGDIVLCGKKNGKLWSVGIKDPNSKDFLKILKLNKKCYSIATSGDYERFYIKNGEKFSHIIDPRNGKSVKGAHSISVISDNATLSDTLSTAISVGHKDDDFIKKMAKKFKLKIYILRDNNKNIEEITAVED